jgi:hypothetical protein
MEPTTSDWTSSLLAKEEGMGMSVSPEISTENVQPDVVAVSQRGRDGDVPHATLTSASEWEW